MTLLFLKLSIAYSIGLVSSELPSFEPAFEFSDDRQTYQIGDEWGKVPLSDEDLLDPILARVARATIRVGGGTGFYLGQYGDHHLIATNHHVCRVAFMCVGTIVDFSVLSLQAEIDYWVGTWKEIDLTIMGISLTDKQANIARNNDLPLHFDIKPYVGQPLVTMGFGKALNPFKELMVNQDNDCMVYSSEIRFISDPDELNPGPDKVWSFANGCDVSHGDSGSAMVDRLSGNLVGIIWTGSIPKDPKVQDRDFLDSIFANQSEEIWDYLSYGVPVASMKYYLLDSYLNEEDSKRKFVLSELLKN